MSQRPSVGDVDARILPSLLFWFRADTHRYEFSDGQNASYAFDESNNGNNLGGGGTVPLYVASGCNGYGSFKFTGAMDLRSPNMAFASKIRGAFAVAKHTSAGNFLAVNGEGIITDYGGTHAGLYGVASTQTIYNFGAADTVYVNSVATNAITNTNAWNLIYIEHSVARSFSGTMMGRDGTGSGFFTGEIAECGYFGALPSAVQRQNFFNALIAKYALTGNVGSPA